MRESVAATIIQDEYIKKLLTLFTTLEETMYVISPPDLCCVDIYLFFYLRDIDSLKIMFNIFRALVSLNETNILERLMDNENYVQVFGVFGEPDRFVCKSWCWYLV